MADLAELSRNHLLYFRLEVDRRLSQAFYNDDPEAYRSSYRQKEGTFRDFVIAKGAELAALCLSEQLLRQSLGSFFVVKDLPRALVAQLVYSHVVQLTAVEDDRTRALLAKSPSTTSGTDGRCITRSWRGRSTGDLTRRCRLPDASLR
jgi:hypothetical protein